MITTDALTTHGSRPIAGGRLCRRTMSEVFYPREWICRRGSRCREAFDRLLLFAWLLSQRDSIELPGEGVMTRSQLCKHQVCDYCGECFDMLTQPWWGNKFCKSTCKNAYLRENGAARLAAALAVAVLVLLLLASANAAPSEEQPPAGVSLEFTKEDGTAYIDLSGAIMASTADDLRAALDKYRSSLNRVVLFLNSAGGRVDDGDRLIEALNEIKLRYRLITVVSHGKLCASMCIPIFLQGEDRLAARAREERHHPASARGTVRCGT
jgi:hypothetical protein